MSGLTKSKERVKKYGEVFTPPWLVEQMLDLFQGEDKGVFTDLASTFLEPSCGNGNFLVGILRRKLALCETAEDAATACAAIYGMDILEDNVRESRRRMERMVLERFPEARVGAILERNIIQADALKFLPLLADAPDWDSAVGTYRATIPQSAEPTAPFTQGSLEGQGQGRKDVNPSVGCADSSLYTREP